MELGVLVRRAVDAKEAFRLAGRGNGPDWCEQFDAAEAAYKDARADLICALGNAAGEDGNLFVKALA